MARRRKIGSLYMVELPSEGVTVPVQIQDEQAWKGSGTPVKGTCGSRSMGRVSAEVPRR